METMIKAQLTPFLTRRQALTSMASGFGLAGLASTLDGATTQHHPAKAKHIIYIVLNGGMSQVDTFDPKPALDRYHEKPMPGGPPKTERSTGHLMKSPFAFKPGGKSGVPVSEIFPQVGAAIDDFMHPDRVVIGANTPVAQKIMRELYAPFLRNHDRIITMNIRDAEMTKYASNAMLATKISFMNEIAELCERLNVDVENVRLGMGSDSRIGYHFIYPGAGYGGSCFPKDVKALVSMAKDNNVPADVMIAVESRNQRQKERMAAKVKKHFDGNIQGKTFCLWGLAFKPGTDDMREAPSLQIINDLVSAGAKIRAYDPVSAETAREAIPKTWMDSGLVEIFDEQYQALESADALILVTEWKQFRNPDFDRVKKLLKNPVIFDGRNQYNPEQMREKNITYIGIGRSNT